MDKEYFLKYINNGEIYIKESEWYSIKKTFEKDEIKDALSKAIYENVNYPLKIYTDTEVINDFYNLSNNNANIFYDEYLLKDDYKYPIDNIYIQGNNYGLIASNNFQQINRLKAFHRNHRDAPLDIFKNVDKLYRLCNFLFLCNEVTKNSILSAIHMNFYVASQFKPSIAKFIYDKFNSKNVLDLSSGWGDRLCGFYASNAESYFGIDPNTNVFKDYFKQIDFYEKFIHKKTHIENLPAEDVDFKDYMFDTIFTSPPYFDNEIYCDEDTQSYKRYTSCDSWLNNFLFKAIKSSTEHLKDNGFLILNIADLKQSKIKLCDQMNDFINSLNYMNYVGCFGIRLSTRTGANTLKKDKPFCEPVWVWQKSQNTTKLTDIFKYNMQDW